MKKANRKLIPALAMLLVSAIMLSTASFAWFSMSNKATASNIKIKATAASNLLLSVTGVSTEYYGSVEFDENMTDVTLFPCSTKGSDGSHAPKFYTLKGSTKVLSADSYAASLPGTGANVFEEATKGNHFVSAPLWVQNVGSQATNLKVSFERTDSESDGALDAAARVMLYNTEDHTYFIYAPFGAASYGGNPLIGTNEANIDGSEPSISGPSSVIKTPLTADTPVKFMVYAWYEGQDEACMARNTSGLKPIAFKMNFSVNE